MAERRAARCAKAVLLILSALPYPQGVHAVCLGDCDGSAAVTIDELIKGVNIALGSNPIGDCPSMDSNTDGEVRVDELVSAVNDALLGCPPPAKPSRLTALYNGYLLTVDPEKALAAESTDDRYRLYVLHAVLIDPDTGRIAAIPP